MSDFDWTENLTDGQVAEVLADDEYHARHDSPEPDYQDAALDDRDADGYYREPAEEVPF